MNTSPAVPNHYKPGECVRLSIEAKSLGLLVDPASITFTIHPAPSAVPMPDIVLSSSNRDSLGKYYVDYVLPMNSPAGAWPYRCQTTGTPPSQNALAEGEFIVDPLAF